MFPFGRILSSIERSGRASACMPVTRPTPPCVRPAPAPAPGPATRFSSILDAPTNLTSTATTRSRVCLPRRCASSPRASVGGDIENCRRYGVSPDFNVRDRKAWESGAGAGAGAGPIQSWVCVRTSDTLGIPSAHTFDLRRAVTSISMRILGSASPAEIIIAAGRIVPKYLRRTGQHSENSEALGTT